MTKTKTILCFFICLLSLYTGISYGQMAPKAGKTWPYSIPCRIHDGNNPDLMIMTLGDVQTSLSQGTFDPVADRVILNDGKVIPGYYKDSLKIKYYRPVDKTYFPLPPSGWCSWYYYYQEVTADEIKRNAEWIGKNLKDYGAEYVQIDDGWQGVGHGNGTNRDWTTIDKRFSEGMDKLAVYIKAQGMIPGLWLAPHGQSNPEVVKNNPGAFILKPDGTSASDTWEGKYLVDPSTDAGQNYLRNLFKTLVGWGYDYFKIDGQPIVVREYRNKKEFMKNPQDDTNALYRKTLESMHDIIGSDRYLVGCWVIPLEGVGIMNGSRTGGDVHLDWRGFRTALRATMEYYYLHNIAWYCDPDVMLVRDPLPIEQAQVWATLQGLTGQALMSSDRMMDLPEERLDIVKRVFPAVDIRPLDLFSIQKNKRIWDLKINHLGRNYDVVGLFNFDSDKSSPVYLNWNDLGIATDKLVHVFDFWNKEYLGAFEKGIALDLPQTSCRVLALVPDNGQIQLVSTSRHITQGWVDLTEQNFNPKTNVYSGISKVVKNDVYELRFAFPKGKNYVVKSATAQSSDGKLPVTFHSYQGWAVASFVSPKTTEVKWNVVFEPSQLYTIPTEEPTGLWIERVGFDGANVRWSHRMQDYLGYQVYLNGTLLGYTPSTLFPLRGLNPDTGYNVEVRTVCNDYSVSDKKADIKFMLRPLLPETIYLSELDPTNEGKGWRLPEKDKTILGKGIKLGGKIYSHGMGVPSGSEVEYELKGYFSTFSALVGIDEENNKEGNDEFVVIADGKELWRSGWMKRSSGTKEVELTIKGVNKLVLKVIRGEGGASGDQTNWADAKVGL